MATTKMTRQWYRWAGTIEDIERATRLALDIIGQRTRTDPLCKIEIALPQRVTNADSPDALQTEIDTRDLDLIRSLRIEVGAKRGLRATIHVERASAVLTVEVTGEDRTRVEGLTSQLEELLRKGMQRPAGTNTPTAIGLILAFGVFIACFNIWRALAGSESMREIDTPIDFVGVVLLLSATLGTVPAVLWLLPELQLLKPGDQPRLRRFRFAAVTFIGGVVTSIIATVIYEAAR
jgi:hypothetical protein